MLTPTMLLALLPKGSGITQAQLETLWRKHTPQDHTILNKDVDKLASLVRSAVMGKIMGAGESADVACPKGCANAAARLAGQDMEAILDKLRKADKTEKRLLSRTDKKTGKKTTVTITVASKAVKALCLETGLTTIIAGASSEKAEPVAAPLVIAQAS